MDPAQLKVDTYLNNHPPICTYCHKLITRENPWIAEGTVTVKSGKPLAQLFPAQTPFGVIPQPPAPTIFCCGDCTRTPVGTHHDFMKSDEMFFVIGNWVQLRKGDLIWREDGKIRVTHAEAV